MGTYTYVVAEVSSACYAEVKELLLNAGYTQALHADKDVTVLDMHGIALRENTLAVNAEVAQKKRWYDESHAAFRAMERERDDALREIEFVVETCLASRQIEPAKQAVWLRDAILTRVDPLMIVTQRIKERA